MRWHSDRERLCYLFDHRGITFTIVAASSCFVHGPERFQDKLDKHGFEISALEMFRSQYSLGLWIQVEVSPQHFLEYGSFDTQLLLIQACKLFDREGPAIY